MHPSSAKTLTATSDSTDMTSRRPVWIHTGAGPMMGYGHLQRCIVLAQKLLNCCRPLILLDSEDLWSPALVQKAGLDFYRCRLHDAWTLQPSPSFIIVDIRSGTEVSEFTAAARKKGIRILSIHDLGLNPLPSDIVVDGSISPMDVAALSPMTEAFLGPKFMILDPAFAVLHQRQRPIRKEIRSILINLGGGDSQNCYLRVLEGLKLWGHDIEGIGMTGFTQWGQSSLSPSSWTPVRFHWESGPVHQHIRDADLAVTAGGISAYEALCAGVPLMALAYDALQQQTIDALESLGACVNLGPGNDMAPTVLAEMLDALTADHGWRARLAENGRSIVDGRGCERVSQIIRHALGLPGMEGSACQ